MNYKLGLLSTIAFCLCNGCSINIDPPVNLTENANVCIAVYLLDADLTNCPDGGAPKKKDGSAD